jgi:predicted phage terminase large subunit-like protein
MPGLYELDDQVWAYQIKVRLLKDFKFFCQYFFKYIYRRDFIWAKHHQEISIALMRIFRGVDNRLAIEAPPQTGKSVITVPLFCAWCFAHNPQCAFMNLSRSDDLVKNNSSALKAIIESDPFRELFGVSVKSGRNQIHHWELEQGGEYQAVSADGQVAGKPSGRIVRGGFWGALIGDDLVKPKAAMYYKRERDLAFSALVDAQSRLGTDETPIIVIMQRTHDDDPIGRIKQGMMPGKWNLITIRALDENGESFWPAKLSTEYLQALRLKNKHFFDAQYLQSPSSDEGTIFLREYWKYYNILPPLEYICIFCDTAQKKGEANDYSVFAAWGYSDKRIYLIDIMRKKLSAPELRRAFWAFVDKHHMQHGGTKVRKVYVEDAVSGTGLIQFVQEEGGIPIEGIRRTTDKVSRCHDSVGYVESGYVYLPERAPWVHDFIDEHAAMPNGDHDDQVDTTNDAIDNMLINKKGAFFFGVC